MAYTFNGTSQRIFAASSPVTSPPITLFCRFNPSANIAYYAALALSATASGTHIGIWASGSETGKPVEIYTNDGTNSSSAASGSFTTNVWQAMAGTTSAANSRFAFYEGAAGLENTTSRVVASISSIQIGCRLNSGSPVFFFPGLLCEVALWDAVLTSGEMQSLSKGFKPSRIRPQALRFYAPLIRELRDWRGGLALTNESAATVANHPRVY